MLAEKVQVRRDLLNQRLTTTCFGRMVFSNDTNVTHVPYLVDFKVSMTECHGNRPDCLHHVEMARSGSMEPTRKSLQAAEIVKIQAKNPAFNQRSLPRCISPGDSAPAPWHQKIRRNYPRTGDSANLQFRTQRERLKPPAARTPRGRLALHSAWRGTGCRKSICWARPRREPPHWRCRCFCMAFGRRCSGDTWRTVEIQAQDGAVLALRPSGEVLMKKLDTARRVVFHHDAGREDVAAHHEFG